MSRKGKKGTKSRTFGQAVGDLKKQGKSEASARRIIGSIQAKQHKKKKK